MQISVLQAHEDGTGPLAFQVVRLVKVPHHLHLFRSTILDGLSVHSHDT